MANTDDVLRMIWNADEVAQSGQLDISVATAKVRSAMEVLQSQRGNGTPDENAEIEKLLAECDAFLLQMADYAQQALDIRAMIARIHEETLAKRDQDHP